MTNVPRFVGRPLVETPEVPMIGPLEGEFGKWFKEAYETVVDNKYKGNGILKVFNFSDNVLKGSSTYSAAISPDIYRQAGLKKASLADIESARKLNETNPRLGFSTEDVCYADCGVASRGPGEPNKYQAKKIDEEIKRALNVNKIKDTVVVFSQDLQVLNDENAPNGVRLSLRDGVKPLPAPVLNEDAMFNEMDAYGMPILDKNGRRISCTNNSGLSGLSLCWYLDLDSGGGSLALSDSGGREIAKKK